MSYPPLPLPPDYTIPDQPLKLIIDTDPGVDDVLAILLALSLPHINLLALTLTFGNTTLDFARDNILRTIEVLKRQVEYENAKDNVKSRWEKVVGDLAPTIQLALGAQGPLMGVERFTASYFHGRDGLSSISSLPGDPHPLPLPPPGSAAHPLDKPFIPAPLSLSSLSSPELLLSLLASHPPNSIRIAALGPLTNLATAWLQDPHTFSRVALISIMGGTLDTPGNTSPVAEFNIYADPWAAKVLFQDSVGHPSLKARRGRRLPIELLPLDLTGRHTIDYERLMQGEGPLGNFISAILLHPRKMTNSYAPPHLPFRAERDDQFQAHDPLAVAHACFALSQSHVACEAYHLPLGGRRSSSSSSSRVLEEEGRHRRDSTGWIYIERRFAIEVEGRLTRGMCVVDRRAHGHASHKRSGRSRAEVLLLEAEEEQPQQQQQQQPPSRSETKIPLKRSNLNLEEENEEEEEEEEGEASAYPLLEVPKIDDGDEREEEEDEEEEGIPGLISIVHQSPLQGEWFARLFRWALGVA